MLRLTTLGFTFASETGRNPAETPTPETIHSTLLCAELGNGSGVREEGEELVRKGMGKVS